VSFPFRQLTVHICLPIQQSNVKYQIGGTTYKTQSYPDSIMTKRQ